MIPTYLPFVAAWATGMAMSGAAFYAIGYRKGYNNGRHDIACGVHLGEYCDCERA